MEHIARVELGMTSETFYSCTWYDWSLWIEKIREDRRKRQEDHELLLEVVRSGLTYYYNWNRGEQSAPLEKHHIWRLSYDKVDLNDNTEPSEEEKERLKQVVKRLESKIKKNRGGDDTGKTSSSDRG